MNVFTKKLFIPAEHSKGGKAITKPIPPSLLPYFQSIPDGCEWAFYRTEGGNRRNPTVSYHPLGDFRKAWDKCTAAAGLSGFRVHDLRHVAASRLANRGVPTIAIMSVAGWRTDMLSTYYGETPDRILDLLDYGGNVKRGVKRDGKRAGKVGDSERKTAILQG